MDWINLLNQSEESKKMIRVWIWLDRAFTAAVASAVTCIVMAIILWVQLA